MSKRFIAIDKPYSKTLCPQLSSKVQKPHYLVPKGLGLTLKSCSCGHPPVNKSALLLLAHSWTAQLFLSLFTLCNQGNHRNHLKIFVICHSLNCCLWLNTSILYYLIRLTGDLFQIYQEKYSDFSILLHLYWDRYNNQGKLTSLRDVV